MEAIFSFICRIKRVSCFCCRIKERVGLQRRSNSYIKCSRFPRFPSLNKDVSGAWLAFWDEVLFFHYRLEIRRWASRHYFISNPVMSCNGVSSAVTRNGMIPIDIKNSCFTDGALPFGVVDKDTQTVLCTNSKLIWCHMKPKSWNGGADNKAPACRTDNERNRADSLSQTGFSLRPWNF